jgi:hypothetical protein
LESVWCLAEQYLFRGGASFSTPLVRKKKKRIFDNFKFKNLGIVRKVDLYSIGKRPWASLDEFQIAQKYHPIFLVLA